MRFGHAATGEVLEGSFKAWSSANPIHFVGHSLGGNTIRTLLLLIKEGHFSDDVAEGADDEPPSASWIASITCICSPLNGTMVVYGLGASPDGSPKVRWGSGGWGLSAAIALVEGSKAVIPWHKWCSEWAATRTGGGAHALASAVALLDFGLDHYFQREPQRVQGGGHRGSSACGWFDGHEGEPTREKTTAPLALWAALTVALKAFIFVAGCLGRFLPRNELCCPGV